MDRYHSGEATASSLNSDCCCCATVNQQAHPHLKGPGPGPSPDATYVQKGPRFPRFTGDRIRPLALTVNVSQHDDEQQRFPGKSYNRTHFCLMANHFHRQLRLVKRSSRKKKLDEEENPCPIHPRQQPSCGARHGSLKIDWKLSTGKASQRRWRRAAFTLQQVQQVRGRVCATPRPFYFQRVIRRAIGQSVFGICLQQSRNFEVGSGVSDEW